MSRTIRCLIVVALALVTPTLSLTSQVEASEPDQECLENCALGANFCYSWCILGPDPIICPNGLYDCDYVYWTCAENC